MQDEQSNTEARVRVLDAAERLFAQRGYTGVTLRDIASEVGIRHTSLYHHAPGGKEELYVEVTERTLRRHQEGLRRVMRESDLAEHRGPEVRAHLQAAARWLLSQPPMDLLRMVYTDLPALAPGHAERLSNMAYEAMLIPLHDALEQAKSRGEINHHNLGLVAGGLLGMIESLYSVPDYALVTSRTDMANELIDVVLNGLRQHK